MNKFTVSLLFFLLLFYVFVPKTVYVDWDIEREDKIIVLSLDSGNEVYKNVSYIFANASFDFNYGRYYSIKHNITDDYVVTVSFKSDFGYREWDSFDFDTGNYTEESNFDFSDVNQIVINIVVYWSGNMYNVFLGEVKSFW